MCHFLPRMWVAFIKLPQGQKSHYEDSWLYPKPKRTCFLRVLSLPIKSQSRSNALFFSVTATPIVSSRVYRHLISTSFLSIMPLPLSVL
ncbi:hypothetical protein VNO78_18304 [Psophocarpus tetragonolobus]|uniref:Uncharacterized protein n=1 Tax=Psophocarpus tetragonolobus TaxID=3891 RepID=A0AAN9XLD5_PSOTE